MGIMSILLIKFYVDKIKGEAEAKQQQAEVFIAARDVKSGESLDDKDIDVIKLPRVAVETFKKSNIKNKSAIVGARAVDDIQMGQALQTYHFHTKTRKSPLVIDREMRAVTIPVTT